MSIHEAGGWYVGGLTMQPGSVVPWNLAVQRKDAAGGGEVRGDLINYTTVP